MVMAFSVGDSRRNHVRGGRELRKWQANFPRPWQDPVATRQALLAFQFANALV